MDAQQQELAAFESSIAEAAGAEPTTTDADDAPAVGSKPTEAAGESVEHEAADQSAGKESGEGSPDEKEKPKAEDEDPVLLDGLKRSELRRLLGNAADVETLKRQIDKAHGHIGELNRRFQQTQAAAPRAAAAQELPPDLQQFEADYPEVAQYVRALGITPQQRQDAPPADVQQAAYADAQPAQAGPDPLAIEMVVMDRMHKGWREKLATQEFSMWLASQGDQVRQAYDTAQTADAMASVLGQYDQWAGARTAAVAGAHRRAHAGGGAHALWPRPARGRWCF